MWCPLARTDQTLGHHDASARAHVDRRVPPGDRPLGCFSNQNWQQPFRIEVVDAKWQIHRAFARPVAGRRDRVGGAKGDKALTLRRLGRAGSRGGARPRVRGSRGPPRSEPSTPGILQGKGRLLEPKSPSGRNTRLRAGIEKDTEGVTVVSARRSPRQFPLHPYTPQQFAFAPTLSGFSSTDRCQNTPFNRPSEQGPSQGQTYAPHKRRSTVV